jgi:hypothetical protein
MCVYKKMIINVFVLFTVAILAQVHTHMIVDSKLLDALCGKKNAFSKLMDTHNGIVEKFPLFVSVFPGELSTNLEEVLIGLVFVLEELRRDIGDAINDVKRTITSIGVPSMIEEQSLLLMSNFDAVERRLNDLSMKIDELLNSYL